MMGKRTVPLAALMLAVAAAAAAGCRRPEGGVENYPVRTVTVICPWAAGGGTDRIARFWAAALEERLGQPFVVANRTGGSGAVGHGSGAAARPDGYTLTMITFELSTMHHMGISPLSYRDFRGILQVNADAAAIVVRHDARWPSLDELLAELRDRPGTVKMSGTATGGAWDLARAGMFTAAGLEADAAIWVPAAGSAPALVELLGGHIDAVCCSIPEAADAIDSGQLRVLAVMSDERLAGYPDVPTVREHGVDWVAVGWRGLAVPRDTPDEIVQRLVGISREIAESDAYRRFMQRNGFDVIVRLGDEFDRFLAEQDAQWEPVIRATGFAP